MRREGTFVRYTAEELAEMRRRGEGKSNVEAVKALTEEELEASIDFEVEGYPDWSAATTKIPSTDSSNDLH